MFLTTLTQTVLPDCLYCSRSGTLPGKENDLGKPCNARHSVGVMFRMPNLSFIIGTRFGYVPIFALRVNETPSLLD